LIPVISEKALRDRWIAITFSAMPSYKHEVPLHMIRQRPRLAVDILRAVDGVDIPAHDQVLTGSENLTTLHPAQLNCDGAVVAKRNGKAVLGIITEQQQQPDPRKQFSWPAYVATFRHRLQCDVALLVLCINKAAAEKFRTPIRLGPPGSVVYPVAVCPADLPPVTDPEEARRYPELAVLTTPAHADTRQGEEVLRAYCEALEVLDRENGKLYHDYAKSQLSSAAQKLLEEIVKIDEYQWQSDFALEHQAIGRAEGRAEGRTEGEVEEAAKALRLILKTRNIAISETARQRINNCNDLKQLEHWMTRAITIDQIDELFD